MKVIISATLRTFFGRIAETEIQGNTIQEILKKLTEEYPDAKKGLYDADGNPYSVLVSYRVRVPYDYYICYVTLNNYGIDAAASSLLTAEQQEMYAIYNETKGNREDLF